MPHLAWTFYAFMNFSKYFVGNKPKGRISKWCFKKTKHVRFSEKRTFLLSDTHTYGLWQWEWFSHQRSPILFHKPTKKYDGQICTWGSNLYFIVQVPSSSRRYDRIMTENSKSSLSIKIFIKVPLSTSFLKIILKQNDIYDISIEEKKLISTTAVHANKTWH